MEKSDNGKTKPNKFKVGDKVVCRWGITYTVTKVYYSNYVTKYLLSNGGRDTIEREDELKFYYKEYDIPPPFKIKDFSDRDNCPRCGEPFHISGFGATKWKDCLKCKRKAENI